MNEVETPTKAFQFQLWHVMVAMVWVGLTVAIGRLTDPFAVAVASIVAALFWLNAFDWFAPIQQSRKTRRIVSMIALSLLVVSMFLPTLPSFVSVAPGMAKPPSTLGWEVAVDYFPGVLIAGGGSQQLFSLIFFMAVGMTNILFPIWVWLTCFVDTSQTVWVRRFGYWFLLCACCDFVIVGMLFNVIQTIGMAVWTTSFLILFTTLKWNIRWAAVFTLWVVVLATLIFIDVVI